MRMTNKIKPNNLVVSIADNMPIIVTDTSRSYNHIIKYRMLKMTL